jgi:hypothetical protein
MPQCALTIFRLGTERTNMRSRITKVAAVAMLAASTLAITAGTARAAITARAAGTARAAITARAAGRAPTVQLTGSQLAADLLPASNFPHGFRYDASTSHESGKRLETGQAKYHLATISCTTLENVYDGPGFGETAVATNSYSTLVDNFTATTGGVFGQSVYQFASASTARSFWLGVRSVAVRCPGFGAAGGHGTEQIVKASIRGTQAFQADFSASLAPIGAIRVQSLIVLRGQDVFEIDALGLGRAVPTSPSLRTLMTRLLTRVP